MFASQCFPVLPSASQCFLMLPSASQCFPVLPNAEVVFCGCVGSGLVLHCPLKTQRRGLFSDSHLFLNTWFSVYGCQNKWFVLALPHASLIVDRSSKTTCFLAHKLSFNLSTLELLHSREHLVSFLSFKNQHSFQFKVHCHLGEGRTGILTKL